MFRMANKRKMSVQNEREMTGHCETLSASFRAKRGTSQKLLDKQRRAWPQRARDRFRNSAWESYDCGVLVVCATRDDRLQCPAKVLEAVQTFFDYVEARGVAEPDRAVVAEGSPRNDGDAGFAQ